MVYHAPRTDWSWRQGRPLACALTLAAIVIAGLIRLIPYITPFQIFNFMPVGALAIFGGARLKWWQALVLPIMVMVVTDSIIWAWFGFRPFNPFVYASFLGNVLLGRLLIRTESPLRIGFMSVLASIQFFVVTNFGAWVIDCQSAQPTYTSSLSGLLECYALGLAFYRTEARPLGFFGNTLLSDLIFTAGLFGAHAFLTRTAFPGERVAPASNIAVSHG